MVAFYIDAVPTLEGIPWETGGKLITECMRELGTEMSYDAWHLLSEEYPAFVQRNHTLVLRGRLDAEVFSRLFHPTNSFTVNLTHLILRKTNITDDDAINISRMHRLIFLDLSETAYVTDKTIQALARSVIYMSPSLDDDASTGSQSLRYVNLRQTHITNASLPYLCRFPNLVALDVSMNNITYDAIISMHSSHSWILLPPDVKLFDTPPKSESVWSPVVIPETHDCPAFRSLHPEIQSIVLGATLAPEMDTRNEVWHYVMGVPMAESGPVENGQYFLQTSAVRNQSIVKLVRNLVAKSRINEPLRKESSALTLIPAKRKAEQAAEALLEGTGKKTEPP